jgi:hypothetical protein
MHFLIENKASWQVLSLVNVVGFEAVYIKELVLG